MVVHTSCACCATGVDLQTEDGKQVAIEYARENAQEELQYKKFACPVPKDVDLQAIRRKQRHFVASLRRSKLEKVRVELEGVIQPGADFMMQLNALVALIEIEERVKQQSKTKTA